MKDVPYIINRPGGFIITDKALNFCSFRKRSKILDLGCGSGATVDYLRNNYELDAYGLDKHPVALNDHKNKIKAKAENIPFLANSMDGVLMECSFSLMDNQEKVLKECYRVLKIDGRLIVSDMYAHGEPAQLKGVLGHIDTKEGLISKMGNNGFTIDYFEDFTNHLNAMWGQMIFEKGAQLFYSNLGTCAETLIQIKCGYCLFIATRKGQSS
jgi:ubiquinone/menaquinone biosynthesis C-methylase UbiE